MAPCVYDITRLVTRMFNVTPNGIDRVDFTFARHFLATAPAGSYGSVWVPGTGPRLMPLAAARAAVEGIGQHWGEAQTPGLDAGYVDVVARLAGGRRASPAAPRIAQGRTGRFVGVARWLREHGLPIGRGAVKHVPAGARYLNVSQFPLWVASYFAWLERRPDVKAIFFIHDLLPLEMPEYFRDDEYERHRSRLRNVARFGAAAIVTTEVVKAALAAHLRGLGRNDMPILVAPTPVSPIFTEPAQPDPALRDHPYFVMCSTIEPRKNHLMLLQVWRELVARDGAAAPRLVLVGGRGWKFAPVIDLLERCPSLGTHVVEVSGLTTPALRRLLDGARALLMPSFGEGYGLPVREALAAGVPVVAADIAVFRAASGEGVTLLSPIDGEGWLAAVRILAETPRGAASSRPEPTLVDYFETIDGFISTL